MIMLPLTPPAPHGQFVPSAPALLPDACPAAVVDRLMAQAFDRSRHRDPRSAEYRWGVRAALDFRLLRHPLSCPFDIGTCQADAWFAGVEEGHSHWRRYTELQSPQ